MVTYQRRPQGGVSSRVGALEGATRRVPGPGARVRPGHLRERGTGTRIGVWFGRHPGLPAAAPSPAGSWRRTEFKWLPFRVPSAPPPGRGLAQSRHSWPRLQWPAPVGLSRGRGGRSHMPGGGQSPPHPYLPLWVLGPGPPITRKPRLAAAASSASWFPSAHQFLLAVGVQS